MSNGYVSGACGSHSVGRHVYYLLDNCRNSEFLDHPGGQRAAEVNVVQVEHFSAHNFAVFAKRHELEANLLDMAFDLALAVDSLIPEFFRNAFIALGREDRHSFLV